MTKPAEREPSAEAVERARDLLTPVLHASDCIFRHDERQCSCGIHIARKWIALALDELLADKRRLDWLTEQHGRPRSGGCEHSVIVLKEENLRMAVDRHIESLKADRE